MRHNGKPGVYFLETGAMQQPSKIVYDRFESSFAHMDESELDWDAIFKDTTWLHYSGITPAISQKAANITLEALQIANYQGIMTSGDINYCRNL